MGNPPCVTGETSYACPWQVTDSFCTEYADNQCNSPLDADQICLSLSAANQASTQYLHDDPGAAAQGLYNAINDLVTKHPNGDVNAWFPYSKREYILGWHD